MPKGMLLRSPREASTIADPSSAFTLEAYEAALGIKPTAPVSLETFVGYGKWFRHQLGSDLDTNSVASVNLEGQMFRVTLDNGDSFLSRRVVVAAGVGPFHRKPAVLPNVEVGTYKLPREDWPPWRGQAGLGSDIPRTAPVGVIRCAHPSS